MLHQAAGSLAKNESEDCDVRSLAEAPPACSAHSRGRRACGVRHRTCKPRRQENPDVRRRALQLTTWVGPSTYFRQSALLPFGLARFARNIHRNGDVTECLHEKDWPVVLRRFVQTDCADRWMNAAASVQVRVECEVQRVEREGDRFVLNTARSDARAQAGRRDGRTSIPAWAPVDRLRPRRSVWHAVCRGAPAGAANAIRTATGAMAGSVRVSLPITASCAALHLKMPC